MKPIPLLSPRDLQRRRLLRTGIVMSAALGVIGVTDLLLDMRSAWASDYLAAQPAEPARIRQREDAGVRSSGLSPRSLEGLRR